MCGIRQIALAAIALLLPVAASAGERLSSPNNSFSIAAPDGWTRMETGFGSLVPRPPDEIVINDAPKQIGGINLLLYLFPATAPASKIYHKLAAKYFTHHDTLANGAKFDWGLRLFPAGSTEPEGFEVPAESHPKGEYIVCGKTNSGASTIILCTSYMDALRLNQLVFQPEPYVAVMKQVAATLTF